MRLPLRIFGLLQVLSRTSHCQPISIFQRIQELETDILESPESKCNFWIGLFKLVNGKSKKFCEENLLEQALLVNEENVVGMGWLIKNSRRFSQELSNDLLASLTTLPFWLSQGGKFTLPYKMGILDHWSETSQISWLVGGYFIGDTFSNDQGKIDIIFSGVQETGIILQEESRQRLWRWLDQRQRYGLSKLDAKSLIATITLSTVSKDQKLQRLAKMLLFLQIYEIQSSFWKGWFTSEKIIREDESDFKSFLWLLTGEESKSPPGKATIILLICLKLGLQIPDIFLGHGLMLQHPRNVSSVHGLSMRSSMTIGGSQLEDCIFWISQDELMSYLECFYLVGEQFQLWRRHPRWQNIYLGDQLLQDTSIKDVKKVEKLLRVLSGKTGEIRENKYLGEQFAISVVTPEYHGHLSKKCNFDYFSLKYPDGDQMKIHQTIRTVTGQWSIKDTCLEVTPHSDSFGTTSFIINNPMILLSAVLRTGEVSATFDAAFDRVFTEHDHWFIGQKGPSLIAIFSYKSIRWDKIAARQRNRTKVSILGSQNLWILHAERVDEDETKPFETFVKSILSSRMDVRENFEDDFLECLNKYHCLVSGPFRFLKCLRDSCQIHIFANKSEIANCLLDHCQDSRCAKEQTIWPVHLNLSHCLSKPVMDILLKWQLGTTVFQFGWNRKLRIWKENVEIQNNISKFRYTGPFIDTKKEENIFRIISSRHQELVLDFKNIDFLQKSSNLSSNETVL